MRVLVVGGTGFLGRRVVAALRRIPDADVRVGSRSGGGEHVEVDLLDYTKRGPLDDFDFVVNCADGLVAAPDKAAEFCLLSGTTFIETSADPDVLESLRASARAVPEPTGRVVLGAGIFPGLSNLLAARVCDGATAPPRLEVGVRYSPLSAAGAGVCRLMARALAHPARRFESSAPIEDLPVTVAHQVQFSGGRAVRALGVGLPESLMLRWSRGAATTGSFLTTVPGMPLPLQRLLALFAPWGLLQLAPMQWLVRTGLLVLRGGLLRWRRSSVELAAWRDRDPRDGSSAAAAFLKVRDGFGGAAAAIAATVVALAERELPRGVHLVDEVLTLDDVVAQMQALGTVAELGLELELCPA